MSKDSDELLQEDIRAQTNYVILWSRWSSPKWALSETYRIMGERFCYMHNKDCRMP